MSAFSARPDCPASAAMRSVRGSWVHVWVFSTGVNLLTLTGSLYMLQIYDRVLASRSVATLVGLSIIACLAFGVQGLLDAVRMRMLARIGATFDETLSPLTLRASMKLPLKGATPAEAVQPMRDLDSIRNFLSSLGPTALIDMPFLPLFLAACYFLHPILGYVVLAGGLLIVSLTFLTERMSLKPARAVMKSGGERHVLVESARRNAETIAALGMQKTLLNRYADVHARYVADGLTLADTASGIGAVAKIVRYLLQSAVLGVGAWLVIRGEMSGGAMIAASILSSRALAPIELAVAHWKGFVAARLGYYRLRGSLGEFVEQPKTLALPNPKTALAVSDLAVLVPKTQRPIIQGVTFEMKAGQAAGIIGPSGSGKSTLARTLVGIWPAARGSIRLDGALLDQWDITQLGRNIGYLPQDVELFDGTIAQNIARFDPDATSESVLKAAASAGAHKMIVDFADGYDTRVGESGVTLSGGQRQRIALARALYGDPFLVVLDEPNSSLDAEGDEALAGAIRAVRSRGGIVVVITHRPSGLAAVDIVGNMLGGRMQHFGPKQEVLQKIIQPPKGQGPGPAPAPGQEPPRPFPVAVPRQGAFSAAPAAGGLRATSATAKAQASATATDEPQDAAALRRES